MNNYIQYYKFYSVVFPLPEVMRTNCTNHGLAALAVRSRFFAERVVNVWNDLPSTVNFALLASFKRTIREVDFSEYMRCY